MSIAYGTFQTYLCIGADDMNIKFLIYHKILRQKGLTLLEMLYSMAIFSLVVLTSFYALTTAHQLSQESRQRLLALNAARSTLEEVKVSNLANVLTINTAQFVPAGLRNGAITIQTNPASITAATTIATITVNVTWQGNKNRNMTLSFSTMRSRY